MDWPTKHRPFLIAQDGTLHAAIIVQGSFRCYHPKGNLIPAPANTAYGLNPSSLLTEPNGYIDDSKSMTRRARPNRFCNSGIGSIGW